MRISKLVRKTLLGLLVLFGVILIATSAVSGWNTNKLLSEQYESKGAAIASSVASSSVEILLNRDASTLQSIIDQYTEIQGVSYVFIADEHGEVVAHTFVPTIPTEVYALRGEKGGLATRDISIEGVGDFSDISSPILAGVAGYVHVGMNKGIIAAQIRSAIVTSVIGVFFIMVLVLAGLALWLTRRITSPVLALTECARSVERGEGFDPQRMAGLTRGRDELADLARVFTQMATTLEQRAEDERLAAEARYRGLFDGVPVGLYWTAPGGQFLDVNPALVTLQGYPDRDALMARNVSESYVNPEDRADWRSRLEREGTVRGFEFQLRRGDGAVIWVRNSARVVRDESGQVRYYDGVMEDITQRKQAEAQVRDARDAAHAAKLELEKSLSLLQRNYDNQGALNSLLRLSQEDVPLDNVLSRTLDVLLSVPWVSRDPRGSVFLADADSRTLVMVAQRALAKPIQESCARLPFGHCLCGRAAETREVQFASDLDERHDVTYEGIAPHGHYCIPLLSGGELLGVITVYVNVGHRRDEVEEGFLQAVADVLAGIIQRKRSEDRLRETMAELERQYQAATWARSEARAILDSASDTMVLVSPDGRLLSVNRRFDDLFFEGKSVEVLGRHLEDFRQHFDRIFADPAGFWALITESIADRERQFTQVISQQWPQPRSLQVSATPVLSAGEDYLGRLYVFRDVTREKEVDRMKSEFVSLVSHELRTPLTSIKGYVDLLLEGEVGEIPQDQQEFLGIIKSNADRLVTLINDLLDISRIESGRVELKLTTLEMPRVIQGVASLLRPQIEGKGQNLTLDLPDGLPSVSGDADRVTQIVTNLVSNAHKYTPAGGSITVFARAEDAWVRIAVQDSGIGLSPEEQSQLFTKFFRAKNRTTQEVGGTGLGLPIVKSLVEMHGGEITVESVPGHGSTFSFTLPAVQEAQAMRESLEGIDPETLAIPVMPGGRILVVDDEPDIANLIRRYLERGGYQVLVAGNGAEALRTAKAEKPDLITLDVQLPDADGFTVLEWLKNEPETASIPVLMLSMMADDGRGKVLGAVDYLTKPTQERGLLERVGRALVKGRPKLVLVVDDDANIRRLLAGYLLRAGYQVLEAGDGAEAVEVVKRERPGLVLMDIRMPGMDGITALQELRGSAETQDVPVVIMTASPGALEEGESAVGTLGVSGLLSKPFTAEDLAEAILRGLASGGQS